MYYKDKLCKLTRNIYRFCYDKDKIYVYGAGRFGKGMFYFLKENLIDVDGFIVSDDGRRECCGIPVYCCKEFEKRNNEKCGIVGAFLGCDDLFIRNKVGEEVATLCFSEEELHILMLSGIFEYITTNKDFVCGAKPVKKIQEWKNILIVRLDVIGDLVLTTPLIREVRYNCPDSNITLVVRKQNVDLFKNCPYISKLLLYECDSIDGIGYNNKQELISANLYSKIFAEKYFNENIKYDVAIMPCLFMEGRYAIETLLLAYASGANSFISRVARYKAGSNIIYRMFKNKISVLHYQKELKHEVVNMLDMLEECGGNVYNDEMELWPDNNDIQYAEKILAGHKFDYCIVLGLVGSTPDKNWPTRKFSDLIGLICNSNPDKDFYFVMIGGNEAIKAGAEVREQQVKYKDKILDLTGKTSLAQATAIIKLCKLYIGADTGIKHIASAVKIPVVELSIALPKATASDNILPENIGPWKVNNFVFRPKKALPGCEKYGRCKIPSHCITQISVEEVEMAVEKLLNF